MGKKLLKNFISAVFVLYNAGLFAQNQSVRFQHFDIEDGLSQNIIRDIIQDRYGFIWIATWDGLNRYDGYEFKIYKNIDGDPKSLRMNKITCLLEDHLGRLWIGTFGGGLSLFNRESETFTNFVQDQTNNLSLSREQIISIYEDTKNRVWIGTRENGISMFDNTIEPASELIKSIKFINIIPDTNNTNNSIMTMLEDRSGTMWFGMGDGKLIKLSENGNPIDKFDFISYNRPPPLNSNFSLDFINEDPSNSGLFWLTDYDNGIVIFNAKTEKFLKKLPYPNLSSKIPSQIVRSLLIDSGGEYWFGTYGDGIYNFKPGRNVSDNGTIDHFILDPLDPLGINAPNITYLFEDKSGLIWVGTNTNGIYTHNRNTKKFTGYYHNSFNNNSLINNSTLSVLEDTQGNVWIGTELGLDKYNPITKKYTHFKFNAGNKGTSSNIVYSILEDDKGTIWVGTAGGLDKYSPSTNSFQHYLHDRDDTTSISSGEIIELFQDSKGSIWLGSWNGGLNKIIPASDDKKIRFLHYTNDKNDPASISDNRIMCVTEDNEGQLWIGTSDGGLNKLISDFVFNDDGKVNKPVFINYKHKTEDPNSLSNNDVRTIFIDDKGILWLGTFGGGLNKFDPLINENGKPVFVHFRESEGLANDVVRGIEKDDSGFLWIGTANGLSRFDPSTNSFLNFDISDGLPTVKFEDVHFKSRKRNLLYFGGVGGVTSFNPSEVRTNSYTPEIVITELEKYNLDQDKMIVEKGISEKKEITLSHNDNIITFKFAALSYFNSKKNKYSYKLEGYNNNWIEIGNKRDVTFTNLDPGEYTLYVKGSNNSGVWNNSGTSMKIIVTPPWWRTNWAFAAYALILITGIFITDRLMRRRVIKRERDRAKLREAELIKTQAEELETVDTLVKVINQAEDLKSLFNSLLKQTMNFIPQAEMAAVFMLDRRDNLFRVAYTAGYKVKDLEKISFTDEELEKRYAENSEEVEKGIYILNKPKDLYGDEKLSEFNRPASMLVMAVELENITEAYVVFDSFSEDKIFDRSAARLLNRFREHAVSAILKAQTIKTLHEKNEEILRTQEQLTTQQKLASLGALTAGIAHEIKNPLNFVNNFSEVSGDLVDEIKELLQKENNQQGMEIVENLKQNLDRINQHGKRADSIVKGMLLHSRGTSGEKTLTDINDLLDQYVNLAFHGMRAQNKEFNITIEKDYDKSLGKINVVPQDISRVFLNIINNACYAAYDKKKESSENNFSPTLKVSTKNLDGSVEIKIGDNGNGIPKEIIDKIFQPFFTTKPTGEGTGLGLSLSYDIVTKVHGGNLNFISEDGKYTEFIITLPKS